MQVNGFTSKSGIFIPPTNIRAPAESKSRAFFTKAERLHLAFTFRMQAFPGDFIVNSLNDCLRAHMDVHELNLITENTQQNHLFSPSSTPLTAASESPDLPWQIMFAKQTPRSYRHLPNLNTYPTADMKQLTYKKLWDLNVNRQGERRVPAVTIDGEAHQLLLIGN